jgi:hypothetical protein
VIRVDPGMPYWGGRGRRIEREEGRRGSGRRGREEERRERDRPFFLTLWQVLEENPKWALLQEILSEIQQSRFSIVKPENNSANTTSTIDTTGTTSTTSTTGTTSATSTTSTTGTTSTKGTTNKGKPEVIVIDLDEKDEEENAKGEEKRTEKDEEEAKGVEKRGWIDEVDSDLDDSEEMEALRSRDSGEEDSNLVDSEEEEEDEEEKGEEESEKEEGEEGEEEREEKGKDMEKEGDVIVLSDNESGEVKPLPKKSPKKSPKKRTPGKKIPAQKYRPANLPPVPGGWAESDCTTLLIVKDEWALKQVWRRGKGLE